MPFIKLSIAKTITEETEQKLIDGLGRALSVIPGKDPQWTMVEVNDGLRLYFGGKKQEDMVFADVKYVGKQEYHRKREFTRAACQTIHELIGTPIDRICLTITEYDSWGAVGDFRDQYYVDDKLD
ncbi:MAG: hypothetical protein IKH56_02135 [Oscillospiraceae bacterium]|nr:hypothetical protein [Oscillospiraceae bacterium]